MELTSGQQRALQAMESGANVFLTGEAGTGKSFVIDTFRQRTGRNVAVCAPTGIAARNVSGRTVNSLFLLKFGVLEPDFCSNRLRDELKVADTLIVDEVSMLRMDMMQAIANTVAHINESRAAGKAFWLRDGTRVVKEDPLQIILCGDFFQLPPVIVEGRDDEPLRDLYGDSFKEGYAFEAPGWRDLGLTCINLTEVVRQGNAEFVEQLNLARHGDPACVGWFNTRTAPEESRGALHIVPKNRMVDEKNEAELARIDGREHVFEAGFTAFSDITREKAFKDVNLPELLKLKVGAKVMLLANGEDYVNGSTGTVVAIEDSGATPHIDVRINGGRKASIFKQCAELTEQKVVDDPAKPGKKKLVDKKIAQIVQYPLRLAYAITIHKSQGQTYSSPVVINPSAWAPGQLYVALSRCTDASKIHLARPLCEEDLVVSKNVKELYEGIEDG